jgi:hypothetical protein
MPSASPAAPNAASFSSGTVVTLTPVPAAGAIFTGWSGVCSGTGGYSVTMSATLKAVHILELRTALNQVYQALRRASPTYTDPTITVGLTTAKAAHVQELRNAVSALR